MFNKSIVNSQVKEVSEEIAQVVKPKIRRGYSHPLQQMS